MHVRFVPRGDAHQLKRRTHSQTSHSLIARRAARAECLHVSVAPQMHPQWPQLHALLLSACFDGAEEDVLIAQCSACHDVPEAVAAIAVRLHQFVCGSNPS